MSRGRAQKWQRPLTVKTRARIGRRVILRSTLSPYAYIVWPCLVAKWRVCASERGRDSRSLLRRQGGFIALAPCLQRAFPKVPPSAVPAGGHRRPENAGHCDLGNFRDVLVKNCVLAQISTVLEGMTRPPAFCVLLLAT